MTFDERPPLIESIDEAFLRVCNVLSHAGKHGMVFCPKKFCFAKEEVEFAGLVIGKDGIRPTEPVQSGYLGLSCSQDHQQAVFSPGNL